MLRQVRDLGFDWIDIQPGQLQTLESQLLAQELGLRIACVGATFGLPAGAALDHPQRAPRQSAIAHCQRAIEIAARGGAEVVYVVPGAAAGLAALERYAAALVRLAEAAQAQGLKLALEHFPGRALASAGETLEFIRQVGHDNLYLLYDSGHIQISGEDPPAVIHNAGDRLAYVHFDDNDGLRDLHWPLLQGVMDEAALFATLKALQAIGYDGALSLELSPSLPQPAAALRDSRDILLRGLHRLDWP